MAKGSISAQKGSISAQIDDILMAYSSQVRQVAKEEFKNQADETKKMLRQSSPRNRKGSRRGYAKDWDKKPNGEGGWVVYNRHTYQLTHLLENGHVIKNGVGKYGRVKPRKHIGPAEDAAAMRLPLRIKARLRML